MGDKIGEGVVGRIVDYVVLMVFVGGIGMGVGFVMLVGGRKVFEL